MYQVVSAGVLPAVDGNALCYYNLTTLLVGKPGKETQEYSPLIFGTELMIDTTYRQVMIDGELLTLTRKEFELLVCLAKHPCQVWGRMQLYHYDWNDDLSINGDNTVKTHINLSLLRYNIKLIQQEQEVLALLVTLAFLLLASPDGGLRTAPPYNPQYSKENAAPPLYRPQIC